MQGHSLGGSLATLLMLMYLRRGVLPAVAISPVYTFGAPAIFCEGSYSCSGGGPCTIPGVGAIPVRAPPNPKPWVRSYIRVCVPSLYSCPSHQWISQMPCGLVEGPGGN